MYLFKLNLIVKILNVFKVFIIKTDYFLTSLSLNNRYFYDFLYYSFNIF